MDLLARIDLDQLSYQLRDTMLTMKRLNNVKLKL
jgi:hypothetical protein